MTLPRAGLAWLFLFTFLAGCTPEETSDRPSSQKRMSGPYLGQAPPGLTPKRFAPAAMSEGLVAHSAPSFSPDGTEAYWSAYSGSFADQMIYFSELRDGEWSAPRVAPFSGPSNDGAPVFSHDGQRLYFSSMRARAPGEPEGMGYVWFVERLEDGWSEPRPVSPAVNWTRLSMQVSVTRDGSIYYAAWVGETTDNGDIYLSEFSEGEYGDPEKLGESINSDFQDVAPCVAPDESYMVFTSMGRPFGVGGADLLVSFRKPDGSWTNSMPLSYPVNSPAMEVFSSLSPDGKYLFFTSDREGGPAVYWVDTSGIQAARDRYGG